MCLASTTCAEGMQVLCNTSGKVRPPRAKLAQAQPQINLKMLYSIIRIATGVALASRQLPCLHSTRPVEPQ